jgi:hypothetical protein
VPSSGSRRVSIFVALPVIIACAVTGSVLGVTHPIRSIFFGSEAPRAVAQSAPAGPVGAASSGRDEKPPEARPPEAIVQQAVAPIRIPDAPPGPFPEETVRVLAAAAAAARESAQPPASETVAPVSTGSVERSLSPGSADHSAPLAIAAAPPDSQATTGSSDVVPSDAERHHAAVNPRVARAKRLRRAMTRRPRTKPPGSPVESFFTSFFAKD